MGVKSAHAADCSELNPRPTTAGELASSAPTSTPLSDTSESKLPGEAAGMGTERLWDKDRRRSVRVEGARWMTGGGGSPAAASA